MTTSKHWLGGLGVADHRRRATALTFAPVQVRVVRAVEGPSARARQKLQAQVPPPESQEKKRVEQPSEVRHPPAQDESLLEPGSERLQAHLQRSQPARISELLLPRLGSCWPVH